MSVLKKDTRLKFPHLLLIDASAGSGKTHTLAQRFVQFLLSGNVPHNELSNILAITFTNNAAREMKERIIHWLKLLALNSDCEEREQMCEILEMSPEEISRRAGLAIEKVLDGYSDFHVQTIDSFMNRILRASAWELGLPPEVQVTLSQDMLIEMALELMFREVAEGKEEVSEVTKRMEVFLDLLNEGYSKSYRWNPWFDMRKKFTGLLEEELRNMGDVVFDDQWEKVNGYFEQIRTVFEMIGKHIETFPPHKRNYASFAEGLAHKNHVYLIARPYSGDPPTSGKKANPELYDRLKAEWNRLAEIIPGYLESLSVSKYSHYGPVYESFGKHLGDVKKELGTIHIGDINRELNNFINRGGLEVVPEVYYSLGDTLCHFLMDEFQDTAPVQWGNIRPLVEESLSKGGTFFAVGDLKQAIFLFRDADYKIMLAMMQGIRSGSPEGDPLVQIVWPNASVEPLETNYRSGGIILEYVNEVFKKRLASIPEILGEDRTGLTTYEQIPKEKKVNFGRVQVRILGPKDKDDEDAPEEPEKAVLKEIVEDVLKRYTFGDIAVLTQKNDDVERIVSWLNEWNYPSASYSSLDVKKRKVVMELLSLLKFLDSPVDDLSFAVFICGNVFLPAAKREGVTRDEISAFIMRNRQTGNDYLYKGFMADAQLGKLWGVFFEEPFNNVEFYPIYDLVSLIFRKFSIFENFPQETSSLVRFLESVIEMEKAGKNSIRDFIETVSERRGWDEGSMEMALPAFINSIRVMTFHKAKGLGFPVVINILREWRGGRGAGFFFDKRGSKLITHYIVKDFCGKGSDHIDSLFESKREDDNIQKLNMLYVCNTRAGDELYCIVAPKKVEKCLELFEEVEAGKPAGGREGRKPEPAPAEVRLPLVVKKEFGPGWDAEPWTEKRFAEARHGEFLHAVLSGIEFIDRDIEKQIQRLVKDAISSGMECDDPENAARVISNFVNSDAVKPWFERLPGRRVHREVEYVDEEGNVQRLDRLLVDAGQVTAIDFKSGTGDKEIQSHSEQVRRYVEMIRQIYPGRNVTGYLAYVDSGMAKEIM
ncbi:MAG: UvrD-helicase domain-containing protein [Candidatus Eisenbacteria bacterium]|nr:UvrD-helicase domain-containing protein [Candidatus Eisenbacteria bacterium]